VQVEAEVHATALSAPDVVIGLGTTDQVAEVAAAGVKDTRAPKVLAIATVSRDTSKSENRLPAI
jgi:hypothetical protein